MRYTCKNCGCELPDDAQFCTRCGTKISAPRCPSCGRILPEDAAFCTFCGTRLAPEETCAENTQEKGVVPLPEIPTVELEPTSSEKAPESVSSPAEAASASLPTQQACPPEPAPLPPNAPPDAAQPSAGEQAVPSASEPIEKGNPDTASGDDGKALPAPAPDVPALPADSEPPAFLLDGKSDIFQRLKQYEQNGDTRSEEYSRLRKQEKSAYFWYKLLVVLICAMINVIFYVLLGDYRIWVKFGMILVSGMVFAPIYVVICSRLSQKCGVKTTMGLLSIFTDKSVSQEEEKIADAGLNYCVDCIQKRHPRACRALEILMAIAGVLSVVCAILCLSVGMGLWGSIRFGVLLWVELDFVIAVVWTWKGWLLLPLLPLVVLYALGMLMDSTPTVNTIDPADSASVSSSAKTDDTPQISAASDSSVTPGGVVFSDLVGEYSYDASFEVDGMYVDGYYALLIYGQSQSVQISEYWRGNAIFNAVWASEDSWDGSTLYFDVAPRDSDYDDMAGTHFLTFVPAAESPYGVDTIYIDGDTDMPFTRDSD